MEGNFIMIYIIVLNWNSAKDTIHCVKSLLKLNRQENIKIIICDNASKTESIEEISQFVLNFDGNKNLIIDENEISKFNNIKNKITLIKNNKNYGYAGGNNRGVNFSLLQDDMQYVWILNNDTEVASDSLDYLIYKFESNEKYGVIGSKLVEFENRTKVQGIGGVINPKFCTTKEIGSELTIDESIDELSYEKNIDYVIGASMMFSRLCLQTVGLMCEDYFLYYEEIDICNRIKKNNLRVGIASRSVVYHKHGASTESGKSDIADYYSVKNRLLISKKFYPRFILLVRFSIMFVIINRLRRLQLKRSLKYVRIIFL